MNLPRTAVPELRRAIGAWPLFLLLLTLPLVAGAWAAASASQGGRLPATGGHQIEGVTGTPATTINPLFAAAAGPERDLVSLVFSGLTRPGPQGDPEADLATDWVVSTDATSFTFNLRRDVTWQDGAPFTAADVKFTADAFSAPGVKGDPSTAEVWRRARVDGQGDFTVVFTFASPFAPFLAYSAAGILPRHLLGRDTPEQLVADSFNQRPVGTGPFRLTSLSPTGAVLARYDRYYLTLPYLQRFDVRFLPDESALRTALESRQVDSGVFSAPVTPADLDALRASGHTLLGGLRPAYSLVYLNLNLAAFQDPAVRRALSLATDRARLVQDVLAGQAEPADAPLPPGTWSGPATVGSADVASARAQLEQAGWSTGADGVRQRRGISLSFTLQTPNDPQRKALAQALAEQWRAIGIAAHVDALDQDALLSDILLPHKYEAVLYGWDPGPDPDPFPAWHSSQRGGRGSNLSNFANPRADQLLELARQSAEPGDRAQIYGAFTDLFRQDVPAVVLFFPRYVYAVSQQLAGVRLGLLSSTADRFADVEEWSLRLRRQ